MSPPCTSVLKNKKQPKMNKNILYALSALITMGLMACNTEQKSKQKEIEVEAKVTQVMTKQMQSDLTPDEVLQNLLDGNKRFVTAKMEKRDYPSQVKASSNGQYPQAVVLACIDSRVPVEYLFDQGIGDIFVVRVAGNIESEELLGSMEYGLGVAGSKLLMVLGHENCGAVKSAIKKVDVGSDNVSTLLGEIEPAVQCTEGKRDIKNKAYFDKVIHNNVHLTIKDIREKSPLISKLEKEGKVKIVAAYYSVSDGNVSILDDDSHCKH